MKVLIAFLLFTVSAASTAEPEQLSCGEIEIATSLTLSKVTEVQGDWGASYLCKFDIAAMNGEKNRLTFYYQNLDASAPAIEQRQDQTGNVPQDGERFVSNGFEWRCADRDVELDGGTSEKIKVCSSVARNRRFVLDFYGTFSRGGVKSVLDEIRLK